MTMNYGTNWLDPDRIRTLLAAIQAMLAEAQAASTRTENPVPLTPWAQKRLGLLSGLANTPAPATWGQGTTPTGQYAYLGGPYVASRPTPPSVSAPAGTTLAERVATASSGVDLAARRARLQQMLTGGSALAGIRSVMGG
jgi:hypothetical protein